MILFNSKNTNHYEGGATKRRSIVKAFTWRAIGTLDTVIISYFLTGQIKTAISIGGIEIFTKMILYFFMKEFGILLNGEKEKFNAKIKKHIRRKNIGVRWCHGNHVTTI
jgi:uncharacterized membrane protein